MMQAVCPIDNYYLKLGWQQNNVLSVFCGDLGLELISPVHFNLDKAITAAIVKLAISEMVK